MGAFVASAAFAPPLAATAMPRSSGAGSSRCVSRCLAETQLARALPAQAPAAIERQMRFDIPAAPLGTVLAEIERISGVEHHHHQSRDRRDLFTRCVRHLHAARGDRARARGHERDLARHRRRTACRSRFASRPKRWT